MYERLPSFVLGFHGCERKIGEQLLSNRINIRKSENNYDWLGHGMYFWENDPDRALEWAKKSSKTKHDPFVIGAVIDLGNCLNLLNYSRLAEVRNAYQYLEVTMLPMEFAKLKNIGGTDNLLRRLDCAVFMALHKFRADLKIPAYNTVRGIFLEGDEIYPGAGFREKDHTQICVRTPEHIQGVFLPR